MRLRGNTVACAAVVVCGAVWFLIPDEPQPVADRTPKNQATRSPPVVQPEPSDAVPPSADSAARIAEPAVACAGDPWEPWPGSRCALAMDRRFSVERVPSAPLFSGHAGWFPDEEDEALAASRARRDPAMPTWRDVFADADEGRALAEAALADPACAEERPPQRAACAADAAAAFGLLQEACVTQLAVDGVRNPWAGPPGADGPGGFFEPAEKTAIWARRVDRLDANAELTTEEYWSRRTRAETAMYRYAWRLMRCTALPESALAWFGNLSTPTGDLGDDKQSEALYRFAARHGVEWAGARLHMLPTIRTGSPQILEE